MDAVDFRILAHLFRDARVPFETIGKAVGLSGNAVKARVHKMEEEGVLRGFLATPDPMLFGYRTAVMVWSHVDELDTREQEILEGIRELGAVRWVDVTLDGSLVLVALYKDASEYDRLERAGASLLGKGPTFSVTCTEQATSLKELTLLDWKIVRALRRDGRKTLKDVVDETGASFKTVKKRMEKLLESEALWIMPNVSTSEATGLVLFDLFVWLDDPKRRQEVLALLPKDAVAFPIETPKAGLGIHLHRENLRAAQADFRKVKSAPGVERAVHVIATRHTFDQWLDARIEAAIRDLERARRPATPAPAARPPTAQPT